MHEDVMMDSSSSPGSDMLGPSQILMSERRLRPPQDQPLKCPRCDSTHTKFCYYNNYSLSQPRYFCKTCRRYWTKGGTLRNIPVGGGFRKNRKSSSSSSANKKLSSNNDQPQPLSSINQNPNDNPMNMMLASSQFSCHAENNAYPFIQPPKMVAGRYLESPESVFFNNIGQKQNQSNGVTISPINFCMDMNTSKINNNGYFSTQFGLGVGGGPPAHHDLGLIYIDDSNDNTNNYNNDSAAQLADSRLHGINHATRELKPSTMMLGLEWKCREGCSDDKSGKESFGYLESWSGMMSSDGNHHQHHQQQPLPSTTTNNNYPLL